ncbi:MAG: hypothetical protein O3A87_10645 [Verrucomicrobia bacterium]|nr:hypothetical protein [Verrucomicrobiota bacterium]MDA1006918.1 hypothetical protein [Verrucomicrobiota bacterium]
MKARNYIMAGGLSLALGGLAVADHHETTDANAPKDGVVHFIKAEAITGKDVWDFHGDKLGSVHCVLVKPSGKRVLLVLNTDELLEKDHKVAIPLERFHVKQKEGAPDEVTYALDTTKEQLNLAPKYEKESKSGLYDDANEKPIYRYWKVKMEEAAAAVEKAADAVEKKVKGEE